MSLIQHFRQLHKNEKPLIIANVWDANSAKIFQVAGYSAVGTSSAALANTYGFADGEKLPFNTLIEMVKSIQAAVSIPVSVDIEGGYGRTATEIVENIEKLFDIGIVGINLEDSLPNSTRHLQATEDFQRILNETVNILRQKNISIFVNLRTDGFLLGLPEALQETINRIKAYEKAGADGIFVPCITATEDIEAVVKSTELPINVMAMPKLPDFKTLDQIGVKRISMGKFLHQYLNGVMAEKAKAIVESQSFSPIF